MGAPERFVHHTRERARLPVSVPRLAQLAALVCVTALAGGSAACATHDANPAFRRTLLFDDRGISVPLPPPSLIEQPEQEVDVHGATEGADAIVAGTKLHIEDIDGEAAGELTLDAGATSFDAKSLFVDLREHCFEVWLETPDGRETQHTFVRAHITGPKSLETVSGCD